MYGESIPGTQANRLLGDGIVPSLVSQDSPGSFHDWEVITNPPLTEEEILKQQVMQRFAQPGY